MSSTNKTAHYELPQFVENDIFNPLVDDNDAYNKIDTALYNIADAEADDAAEIISIKSRLDSAEGDIDALEAQAGNSVLTTTAQTLSGAVNELKSGEDSLDGRLDTVEDDINNLTTGLKVKVEALETKTEQLDGDKISTYDTVADMLADESLEEGMTVKVLGYYAVNDFGAASYLIVSSGSYQLNLANGLHARIIHDGTVNIAQFGAKYSDGAATKAAFDKILAMQIKHVLIPPYEYAITGTVELTYSIFIEGMHPTYSRLTKTDITTDLFVVGTVDTTVVARFSNFAMWNDASQTAVPDKSTGTGTGATNKCINLVNAKGSSIDNVKINRFEYAIFIANGNYSIDIISCKIHADDNGVYLDGANQAIYICLCDFDYNTIGVRVDSGIGALVVDKCQIENCRVGVVKRNAGDINIINSYFDANGRRSIELIGALRKVVVENNVFLENSLSSTMIDATSMTGGEVFLITNVVNSVNSTSFISGTAINKYDMNNTYVNNAVFVTNVTRTIGVINTDNFGEYTTHGELATSGETASIKVLKKTALQRIYSSELTDYSISVEDVNDLPNSSVILCKTVVKDGNTVSFVGSSNLSKQSYTNSSGSAEALLIVFVKTSNTDAWDILVLKSE